MLITGATLASGRLVFQFFPSVSGNNVVAHVAMPEGYPITSTKKVLETLQTSAALTRAKIDGDMPEGRSAFTNELSSIGVSITQGAMVMIGETGSHIAEVSLNLVPYRARRKDASGNRQPLARADTSHSEALELSFSANAVSLGADIDLELRGRDIDELGKAAAALDDALHGFDSLYDISNSYRSGKRELTLEILPAAETLGLTQADLGNQVRDAFYGREAQRVQRGRDDVRVMVRFPEADRKSLSTLESMRIRLPDGTEVQL